MFDFAVVVFGVCTLSLLQLPYLILPLSDRHPSREGDNAMGLFGSPSSISL